MFGSPGVFFAPLHLRCKWRELGRVSPFSRRPSAEVGGTGLILGDPTTVVFSAEELTGRRLERRRSARCYWGRETGPVGTGPVGTDTNWSRLEATLSQRVELGMYMGLWGVGVSPAGVGMWDSGRCPFRGGLNTDRK